MHCKGIAAFVLAEIQVLLLVNVCNYFHIQGCVVLVDHKGIQIFEDLPRMWLQIRKTGWAYISCYTFYIDHHSS